jgi:hypothetical protein
MVFFALFHVYMAGNRCHSRCFHVIVFDHNACCLLLLRSSDPRSLCSQSLISQTPESSGSCQYFEIQIKRKFLALRRRFASLHLFTASKLTIRCYNHLLLISPCDVDFQAQWLPKHDFPPESTWKTSVADYRVDLLQI